MAGTHPEIWLPICEGFVRVSGTSPMTGMSLTGHRHTPGNFCSFPIAPFYQQKPLGDIGGAG